MKILTRFGLTLSAVTLLSSTALAATSDSNPLPLGESVNKFYFGLQLGLGIVNTFDEAENKRLFENATFLSRPQLEIKVFRAGSILVIN